MEEKMINQKDLEFSREIIAGWKDFSNFTVEDVEKNIEDCKRNFATNRQNIETDYRHKLEDLHHKYLDDMQFLSTLKNIIEKVEMIR